MIEISVIGATRLAAIFEKLPADFNTRVMGSIEDLTAEMAAIARGNAPHRSGALAVSIKTQVKSNNFYVRGIVYTLSPYALATEYGAHATNTVRAREQRTAALWHKVLHPSISMHGGSFSRTQNIPESPFMRPALSVMSGKLQAAIQAATDQVVAEANAEISAG